MLQNEPVIIVVTSQFHSLTQQRFPFQNQFIPSAWFSPRINGVRTGSLALAKFIRPSLRLIARGWPSIQGSYRPGRRF